MTNEQSIIYENIKNKFGVDKANEVIENWDYYKNNIMQENENKLLLQMYKELIEFNKKSLLNITIRGDYLNNNTFSYSSTKDGFLMFEDENTNDIYKTHIKYEEFKNDVNTNLEDISTLLVYLDSSMDKDELINIYDVIKLDSVLIKDKDNNEI